MLGISPAAGGREAGCHQKPTIRRCTARRRARRRWRRAGRGRACVPAWRWYAACSGGRTPSGLSSETHHQTMHGQDYGPGGGAQQEEGRACIPACRWYAACSVGGESRRLCFFLTRGSVCDLIRL